MFYSAEEGLPDAIIVALALSGHGLPEVRLYDLWHIFATLALQKGVAAGYDGGCEYLERPRLAMRQQG